MFTSAISEIVDVTPDPTCQVGQFRSIAEALAEIFDNAMQVLINLKLTYIHL